MVKVHDIGATLMASNITTASFAKHVDIRYTYVNNHVEDKVVKIIFLKSDENAINILTKNFGA